MNGRLGLIQLLRSCWILEPCSYLALAENWNAGGDFGEITDYGRIVRRSDFGEITDSGRIVRRSDFGEITDSGRPGTPSLLLP